MKKMIGIRCVALLAGNSTGGGVKNIHRIGIFGSNAFLLDTEPVPEGNHRCKNG